MVPIVIGGFGGVKKLSTYIDNSVSPVIKLFSSSFKEYIIAFFKIFFIFSSVVKSIANLPLESFIFKSALNETKIETICISFFLQAICKAVPSFLLIVLTSISFKNNKIRTIFICPLIHAKCKGVYPSLVKPFIISTEGLNNLIRVSVISSPP